MEAVLTLTPIPTFTLSEGYTGWDGCVPELVGVDRAGTVSLVDLFAADTGRVILLGFKRLGMTVRKVESPESLWRPGQTYLSMT
jgi:hypothetical protein